MDLFMAAKYYDLVDFQNYNFSTSSWGTTFKGQLKRGDQFLSIYHRPTRKRMMYTDGVANFPSSPVVRVVTTGEVFMVGALQPDVHDNTHYRNIYSLTLPNGVAKVYRKAPVGPSNDPGWAVQSLVETTWADVELRSLNENEDTALLHNGHFVVTLPNNSIVEPLDTIEIGGNLGQTYYILERYIDSNLVNARAVARDDELVNFVYKSHTGQTYANQTVTQTYTNYNVTGRVAPVELEEQINGITANSIKVFIKTSWIGVIPKLKDVLVYGGQDFQVKTIKRDPLTTEWHIVASA